MNSTYLALISSDENQLLKNTLCCLPYIGLIDKILSLALLATHSLMMKSPTGCLYSTPFGVVRSSKRLVETMIDAEYSELLPVCELWKKHLGTETGTV